MKQHVATGAIIFEPGDSPRDEGWRYGYHLVGTVLSGWGFVAYDDGIEFVEFAGWIVPRAFRVKAELTLHDVVLVIVVRDGEPVIREFRVLGHQTSRLLELGSEDALTKEVPVTSQSIRRLPVRRLHDVAVLLAVHKPGDPPEPFPLKEWSALYSGQVQLPERRRGPLDDAHYRDVARAYREAARIGDPPVKAVERLFHASRSTAGRWVMEARRRGFLGRTRPGKAGEEG